MKNILFNLSLSLLSLSASAFTPEMKTMTLPDGEKITARLCLPENPVKTIVFCIHGTGTNNYLNKRGTFNYYDAVAEGFCSHGIAFFTYNRRGVDVGDTPPLYNKIDTVKYAKYQPVTEAEDIESMLTELRRDKRFKTNKIILYGISEGTIIASMVAERKKVKIDALFLHGYAHENMYDIIKWQDEGNGVMIMANSIFDQNGDNAISREEYENKEKIFSSYRSYLFHNNPFDSLDVVKNNFIDIEDIRKIRMPFHDELMRRISENDWLWIRNNYFNITPKWFKEHFALEPNKTRLLRVNIPIHIFHGMDDANVPVEKVYDLQSRFNVCNKNNLTIHVFEKHDHDLNFLCWLIDKKWSEGYQKLFECAMEL